VVRAVQAVRAAPRLAVLAGPEATAVPVVTAQTVRLVLPAQTVVPAVLAAPVVQPLWVPRVRVAPVAPGVTLARRAVMVLQAPMPPKSLLPRQARRAALAVTVAQVAQVVPAAVPRRARTAPAGTAVSVAMQATAARVGLAAPVARRSRTVLPVARAVHQGAQDFPVVRAHPVRDPERPGPSVYPAERARPVSVVPAVTVGPATTPRTICRRPQAGLAVMVVPAVPAVLRPRAATAARAAAVRPVTSRHRTAVPVATVELAVPVASSRHPEQRVRAEPVATQGTVVPGTRQVTTSRPSAAASVATVDAAGTAAQADKAAALV
jgi:hypothetical protein